MELTNELMKKARKAENAEELVTLAKENGKELTIAQAEEVFAKLHREGMLADEELDNVSGGCSGHHQEDACPMCGCTKKTWLGSQFKCDKCHNIW